MLGLISWWRGHEIPPLVLGTLAVALLVARACSCRARSAAGAARLDARSRWWSASSTAGIILGVFYYLVMAPVGFILRLFRDPLEPRARRAHDERVGEARARRRSIRARYERQF